MKRTLANRAAALRHTGDEEKRLSQMIEENEYGKRREKYREEIQARRRIMAKHGAR